MLKSSEPVATMTRFPVRRWLKIGFVFLLCFSISFLVYLFQLHLNVSKMKANQREREEQLRNTSLLIPPESDLENLSHEQLAALYHRYINTPQMLCRRIVRMGKLDDGGWDICDDDNYRIKAPCLVYSFGIDYDFSFDDAMAEGFGCELHSFDPSMTTAEGQRGRLKWFHRLGLGERNEKLDDGWQVYTLQTLKEKLGHEKRKINILKVDIEESEWGALPQMLDTKMLDMVDQLIMELHISMGPEPMRVRYFLGLTVLHRLYNAGFRIFFSHRNLWCHFLSRFENIDEVGCHEVSFLRVKT